MVKWYSCPTTDLSLQITHFVIKETLFLNNGVNFEKNVSSNLRECDFNLRVIWEVKWINAFSFGNFNLHWDSPKKEAYHLLWDGVYPLASFSFFSLLNQTRDQHFPLICLLIIQTIPLPLIFSLLFFLFCTKFPIIV